MKAVPSRRCDIKQACDECTRGFSDYACAWDVGLDVCVSPGDDSSNNNNLVWLGHECPPEEEETTTVVSEVETTLPYHISDGKQKVQV